MRMELPVSLITVTAVQRLTPGMARVTFRADTLPESVGATPDQQVKLCFARAGQERPLLPDPAANGDSMRWYQAFLAIPEDARPVMRSYTIRARRDDRVDIDFVLHGDAGPATRWASSAEPGDVIGMVGPSADYARPLGEADLLLLVGDETALPAIGTIVESLPAHARAVAYIEVTDKSEEQRFDTRADVTLHYLHRGDVSPGKSRALVDAVRRAELPAGSVFAWLAGESGTVRALRRLLVAERGMDKGSIDFSGYWRLKLTQDDAPTEEDIAEAQERLAQAQAEGGGTAWT
ncbi:siderophore-interacting protein [Streptomyces sp. NPDC002889]|uniref:siderophore-interacting protein n=1 Tax=Streptomyces sp. NPDC002889 TaxID=3364669 RepID=UPI0036C004B9